MDAPGPPTLLDKPKVAERLDEKIALQSCVVDPHWLQCADPGPDFYLNSRIRIQGVKSMRIRILVRLCRQKKLNFYMNNILYEVNRSKIMPTYCHKVF